MARIELRKSGVSIAVVEFHVTNDTGSSAARSSSNRVPF